MYNSIITNTDSYKVAHYLQYPPETKYVFSYIESRGGIFDQTVFFGLQAFIYKYLSRRITMEDIQEAQQFFDAIGEVDFNREGWEYILYHHNGYLPLTVYAAPEGSVIPVHNILVGVINTDPKCYWLTSYIETALLRAIWYPTTVASLSFHCKEIILDAYRKSSTRPISDADYKLHDFGARGVSSNESAGLGALAHLVMFEGTDTLVGKAVGRQYYDMKFEKNAVIAAEHSTVTSWGRDHEADSYKNMLDTFANNGRIVSIVSDSYDIDNAAANIWGGILKNDVIEAGKNGSIIVIRPDSGNPTVVPVRIIDILAQKFGYTVNEKGYKVLPDYVRVIQGDGIDINSIPAIIHNLTEEGYSIDNLTFGMGGGLLQHVNRDTLKFAMKCSAAFIGNEWVDVYKDPKSDHGKKSKRGRLDLVFEDGEYKTIKAAPGSSINSVLQIKFQNGFCINQETFNYVKERARGECGK